MNDSTLWKSAGPTPPATGGFIPVPSNEPEQPQAAKASAPLVDSTAPTWRVEPLQCQITNRHAHIGYVRNVAIELSAGETMQRRTNEAEAEAAWKETEEAQKYLRLRDKLTAADEEHRQALLRESHAGLNYNEAIQHGDAPFEGDAWEQVRAEVEDSKVRLQSIQDAADMAYLVAVDSYRQFMAALQNDKAQSSGQAYREALAALAAAIGPLLDNVYLAKHSRDKQLSPRSVEAVLPSPKLPALNLDPPVLNLNERSPTAQMNSPRRKLPAAV